LNPDSIGVSGSGHGIRIRICIPEGKMELEKGNKILNLNVLKSWMFSLEF
jgi:hypothetical protein